MMLDQILLSPSVNVECINLQDESVLLDLSTGRYYTLNHLGSVIWEQCKGHNTIRDIHAFLCHRFDACPEQVLDDLITFITQLEQEGLLQRERR